jgi:hypothetical protein
MSLYFISLLLITFIRFSSENSSVNISTGNGYWADCKARFWQAERHAKGVADVAYCMKMFLTQPFQIKNWFVLWFVF